MGRTLTNVVELVVQPICTLYIWQINMFKPSIIVKNPPMFAIFVRRLQMVNELSKTVII